MAIDVEKARTEGYKFGIADSSPSNNYIGYDYFVRVEGNDLVIYFDDCLISASVSAKVNDEPFTNADPSHHTTLTNGQELRLPLPAVTDNNSSGGGGVTAVIEGNGNQRTLTITVDGVKYPNQPWSNNGSSTYELGGYKFNVAIQGNKVSDITILEKPATPSSPSSDTQRIVYLFFHLEKGITHYDTWLK
ncbi:MAG: hypothetical protein FWC60_01085 [Firmicutes bacterium]|nr:hypothetical protein [Bacillota bacterium]